uniref:acetate--CoA ligase n=1 Tax=Echinostoma caproni TaxID=27848 RepID=A0A183B5R2_9TREM
LALRSLGVSKGDRVAIYMPMVPQLIISMLACARIGAVHSVVFGGFSSPALADRIIDADCKVLITCDGAWRGAKLVDLYSNAAAALQLCQDRGHTVSNLTVRISEGRDIWWHDLMAQFPDDCECPIEWMNAEDPLFILYTSGSTGRPKGILHTIGGYMVYAATTFYHTFHYEDDDVYWCTADAGWITGHSYVVYGPMVNGATSVIFEGIPTWPDMGRCWAIIDRYQVTKFYTAPTAIRTLMAAGDSFVTAYKRTSLKVGCIGLILCCTILL